MARRYGWGPTAGRVVGAVPRGHRKTTTFVAALRCDGLTAPMAVDGAITGELFRAYVEQVLAPTLRRGDLVVMGNLRCHEVAGVAEAVRRAKARVVYLPAYSPDLDPTGQVFAKLKGELRKRAERSVDWLWATLGESLERFPPELCRNYHRHAGHTPQAT